MIDLITNYFFSQETDSNSYERLDSSVFAQMKVKKILSSICFKSLASDCYVILPLCTDKHSITVVAIDIHWRVSQRCILVEIFDEFASRL
jgi:hypothetical protein